MTEDTAWATEALALPPTRGGWSQGAGGSGSRHTEGGVGTRPVAHLLVFQQDQAHDGDVDGVPDAGVVEKAGHLPGEVRPSPRMQGGYGSHHHPDPHSGSRSTRPDVRLPSQNEGLPDQPQERRPPPTTAGVQGTGHGVEGRLLF